MSDRREFISKAATICLAGITAGKLTSLHADGHMVSESDPNAKALGYVADASNAKGDKFKAGSNCSNCALFQGGSGDVGNCPLFGGKKVAASTIEQGLLEECMREHLNKTVKRKICVISPLRLIIANVEENFSEDCSVRNHPQDKSLGERIVQFGKNLYIERSDFQVNPDKDFFRLKPGGLVRLKYAFVAECTGYEEKDGLITSVTVKIFKDSKSGTSGSNNYKVKGNIHWLNESTAKTCRLHIYHNLFTQNSGNLNRTPDEEMLLNKNSLETLSAFIEQSAVNEEVGTPFQFERHGYFILANKTNKNRIEFGKIISLKDSWKKC